MNNNSHETPNSAPSEVINFDEEVRKRADIALETSTHPENADKEKLRLEIMQRLDKAEGSAARGQVMQTIFDTYGLDAILGFFFPEVGDVAVSATLFAYFFTEAIYADLPKTDIAKLAWYQLVDFAVGAIPIVGDAADHGLIKANKWSAELFIEHRNKLIAEAEAAAIPMDEIQHMLTAREELASASKAA